MDGYTLVTLRLIRGTTAGALQPISDDRRAIPCSGTRIHAGCWNAEVVLRRAGFDDAAHTCSTPEPRQACWQALSSVSASRRAAARLPALFDERREPAQRNHYRAATAAAQATMYRWSAELLLARAASRDESATSAHPRASTEPAAWARHHRRLAMVPVVVCISAEPTASGINCQITLSASARSVDAQA